MSADDILQNKKCPSDKLALFNEWIHESFINSLSLFEIFNHWTNCTLPG